MNIAELLESRKPRWQELEDFLIRLRSFRKKSRLTAEETTRFSELYRGVCADLALAEAYRLPPGLVQYLNDLVGRTHNKLYRNQAVTIGSWGRLLGMETPRLIFGDSMFWLAMLLFWGPFLLCMSMAKNYSEFAPAVLGTHQMESVEQMFSKPFTNMDPASRVAMGGFYVYNNAGIGLQCFAFGAFTIVGPILIVLFNAVTLGTTFGHMASSSSGPQFFEFVTAHGPFELTAIVMATAAGLRIGRAIIHTKGYTRSESIRREAHKAIPVIMTATCLFCLAAPIEAFISPNPLTPLADLGINPINVKQGVALISALFLFFYIVVLGGLAHWQQKFTFEK